jgi:hypothetical protein
LALTGIFRNSSSWQKTSRSMVARRTLFRPFARVTQDGYGPGYGEVEAHVLYMMLRYLKPSNCVEAGSGISTFYMLSALWANRQRDGVESEMTCVEPSPNDKLRELASEQNVRLRECEVQDIEFSTFQKLAANDVLFIDTSHVSKKTATLTSSTSKSCHAYTRESSFTYMTCCFRCQPLHKNTPCLIRIYSGMSRRWLRPF